MKKLLLILCLLLAAPLFASAYTSPGKPTGLVNDFAGVLTAEERATLEQTLLQNRQATGNEIAVVTIPSLDGDTVENYAEKLFKEWGIGQKSKDNGALLLVAVGDRAMRIEVGYGLEPVLTDAVSSYIIRNALAPEFKQNKYYEGITAGVAQIIAATKGEVSVPTPEGQGFFSNLQADFILFWLGLGILQWLLSILARSRSWWMGGAVGGIAGLLTVLFTTLTFGLIVAAVLVPLGLLLDFVISREYEKSKALGRSPRWWAGGPYIGPFGGRGGGFGGFGGGRSGGGGASGSW